MNDLNEILSNRELASIVWFVLFFAVCTFKKEVRKSVLDLIKAFFVTSILSVILLLGIYTFGSLLILRHYCFWDLTLMKDTIFWFGGFAFMTLLKLNKAKQTSFFFSLIKDSFKLTIFIEFFLNFYTFSFIAEMILIPIFTTIFLMNLISQNNDEYQPVNKLTSKFIGLVGLIYFGFALYKIIFHNQNIFSNHNLNTLVLPVLLTVLGIPFFYFTALYSNYERLFMRVKFMNKDAKIQRKLKKQILWKAKLNLNTLNKIDNKLTGFNLYELTNIKEKNSL
jgi:hypothetical protein